MPPPVPGRFFVLLHLLHLLCKGIDFLPGLGRCLLRGLRCRLGAFSGLLCTARRCQRLIGCTLRLFHIVFRRTAGQQKRQANNRQYCGTTQQIHLGFTPLLCCPQHITRCQCQRQCIRAQKARGSDIFWSLARQQRAGLNQLQHRFSKRDEDLTIPDYCRLTAAKPVRNSICLCPELHSLQHDRVRHRFGRHFHSVCAAGC